ncbi:MAG TPA: class I SAM-dependent methyltransferase [Pyrinomonadaceae bacterium]|jgi:ubiquinone/menaquinone biosynthesis C-methylase UbiE
MASRPFYGEYAWAYDLLAARPVGRMCDGIEALLDARGVHAGARILDAGCGAGHFALELARRGYRLCGLDLSAPMLAEACERVKSASVALPLVRGDMLALPFGRQSFDAVLCRGVLNDLLDDASRAQALNALVKVLRPGGALLMDVREWDGSVRRKTREPVFEKTVNTPRGALTFRSVTRLDQQTRRLHISEEHTLTTPGGGRVSAYDFVMRCWTREELQGRLTAAGFGAVEYFGGYDRETHDGATDRIVAVASLA